MRLNRNFIPCTRTPSPPVLFSPETVTISEFESVFAELKAILLPYAETLAVTVNTDDEFHLNTRHIQKNNKPLFFGAVQIKKNYVSFHLMPV
jgi:hypothetical protein